MAPPDEGCSELVPLHVHERYVCGGGTPDRVDGATVRALPHPSLPVMTYVRFEGGPYSELRLGRDCLCEGAERVPSSEPGTTHTLGWLEAGEASALSAHVLPEDARYSFWVCAGRHDPPVAIDAEIPARLRAAFYGE